MPLYEYECRVCGVRFERQQSITDGAIKTCPECGGEVRRVIHPTGIVFKGKGFYKVLKQEAPYEMPDPNPALCVRCGLCAQACPVKAIQMM